MAMIFFVMQGWSQTTLNESFEGATFPPTNWRTQHTRGSGSAVWQSYTDASYAHTGSNSAAVIYDTDVSTNYLITPNLSIDSTNFQISFWARVEAHDGTYQNTYLRIMASLTNDSINSFDTTLLTLSNSYTGINGLNDIWQQWTLDLSAYIGQNIYIAFKNDNDHGYSILLDDVTITNSTSCSMPTNLTVTNITSTDVQIGWTNTNGSLWNIQYMEETATNWDNATIIQGTTSNPYLITGLITATAYKARVQTDCITEQSEWSDPISFITACSTITTFPWNEGFETAWASTIALPGNAIAPNCWININGGYASSSYIWRRTTSSTYIHSGNAAAQMYTPSSRETNDWLISPIVSLNGMERLRFWAKGRTNYIDQLTIKILNITTNGSDMNTENDTSLFVELMPNTIVPTENWEEYELNLSQYSGDFRIAFVKNTTGGYYLNLDDIEISLIPNCQRPTVITVSNINPTNAEISWTNGSENDGAWWIFYKEFSATDYDSIYTNTNPTILPNLTPATGYNIYIKTDCTSETSEASHSTSFYSGCSSIVSFPWREGFENSWTPSNIYGNSNAPICWTNINKGETYPYGSDQYLWTFYDNTDNPSSSQYTHSGIGAAQCYTNQGTVGHNDWLITPLISFTGNERLRFWAQRASSTSSLPDEISIFISNANITLDTISMGQYGNMPNFTQIFNQVLPIGAWQEYEINLNQYTGNRYIAFVRQNTPSGEALRLDDILVETIPNCLRPTSLTVSNISQTSATLSWINAAGNNSWYLYYKESSATNYDSILISTNPYQLQNLVQNTTYNIFLRTNCVTELSEETPIITFTTPCNAITTLPFTENFDNYGIGVGTYPNCWGKLSTETTYPFITTSNSSGCLYFYSTDGQYCTATTSPFDSSIHINTLLAQFQLKKDPGYICVGVMTDPLNISTFDTIAVLSPETYSSWEDFEVNFSSYQGAGHYIAFKCQDSYNEIYLDNLSIDFIPSCYHPSNISISNIATTSATINWTNGNINDNSWWLYYKKSNSSTYDSIHVTSNPYLLQNLLPSSTYNIYLATDCQGILSNTSDTVSFRTECGAISSFPWTEGFEGDWAPANSPGNMMAPYCWTNINKGNSFSNYWMIEQFASSSHSGSHSAKMFTYNSNLNNDWLISPLLSLTGNERLRFWSRNDWYSNYPEEISIWIFDTNISIDITNMTDSNSVAGFSQIFQTVIPIGDWQQYEVNLSQYSGNRYIAFVRRDAPHNGNYLRLDDIEVSTIPTCPVPTGITASNITLNDAEISWTSDSQINAWWLYWKESSATNYDSTYIIGTPTYTFTSLLPNTSYDIYVITECNDGLSTPSDVYSFRTNCENISSLPWSDSFDTYGTGINIFPSCWTKINTYSGLNVPYITTNTFTNTYYSTPGSLYFLANFPSYNLAATPEFDPLISINILSASFMYYNKNDADKLIIGVMTDPTDISTFDSVTTVTTTTTQTWEQKNINFQSYQGIGRYIAFKNECNNPNTGSAYAYIDNLIIDVACQSPSNITITNISNTTANINWIGYGETSWQIRLDENGTIQDLSTHPYQLTGLTAGTNYTIYIRANCGNSYSQWISQTFTTTNGQQAPIVTTYSPSGIVQVSAILTGSYIQGTDQINAKGFEWKLANDILWTDASVTTGTTPFVYTLNSLNANTQYKVRAYVVTTTEGRVYGDSITFSTLPHIIPNVTTTLPTNITQTTVTLNGTTAIGTESIQSRGFEYKLTTTATWNGAIDVTASGTTTISVNVTGLTASTQYDVRAYAQTASGKTYGNIETFTTLGNTVVLGEVNTQSATNIDTTSAVLNGTLVSVGNALSNIEVGFVYSTTSNPILGVTNVLRVDVPYVEGMTTYSSPITELQHSTIYYVKAFVNNSVGDAYGDEVTFKTDSLSGLSYIEANKFSVSMYPNPATNTTKLVVSGIEGEAKIVISDVQGRILNTTIAKAVNGKVEQTIDVNNFAKGIYYVRIKNTTTSRTQKLIVQ
jgi:hypothetical protein